MKRIEDVQSLTELLDVEPEHVSPTEDDLRSLRTDIGADLAEIVAEWGDRPEGPLRITKGRMQSTGLCLAQVLAEAEPFVLDTDVARGTVCDIAAGVVTVHPTYEPSRGWFDSLRWALAQERPDIVALVEELTADQREVFFEAVDERCDPLPNLIGDVRQASPTIRERARVVFDEANVLLTAETDLVTRGDHPTIVELKSGNFGPWILDELRFYALVRSLRDLRAPSFLCAISLADRKVTAIPLRIDDLFAAARRVVDTAEALIEVDRSVVAGRAVQTSPGGHCRWCRRVRVCPDVSDAVLSELPAITVPEGAVDDDF